MKRPRARFTVRQVVIGVFLIGLSMAIVIQRERFRRAKNDLINQEIRVQGAYAKYENAVIAHQNIRDAAIRYLEERGKHGEETVMRALSEEEDSGDRTFEALKSENRKALADEWAKKAIWEQEQATLGRLIRELQSPW